MNNKITFEHKQEIINLLKKSKIKIINIYGKNKPDYYNGFRLSIKLDQSGHNELKKLLDLINEVKHE